MLSTYRTVIIYFSVVSLLCAQNESPASWDDISAELFKLALMVLGSWLVRRGLISHEIEQGIEAAAQRAKDKYVEKMLLARDPESDGGVEVTHREMSEARQEAYQYLLGGLGTAAKRVVETKGPDWAKGLLGAKLDTKLIEAGIERAYTAVPPGGSAPR